MGTVWSKVKTGRYIWWILKCGIGCPHWNLPHTDTDTHPDPETEMWNSGLSQHFACPDSNFSIGGFKNHLAQLITYW